MPKMREIVEICQFAKSRSIEKSYNEGTCEDNIKILGKGEALITKDDGSGGIYTKPEQGKLAK